MPRTAANNPRQIRAKTCGCPKCTARFRPGEKPTRKDCTGPWQARYRDPAGNQKAKNFTIAEGGKKAAEAFLDSTRTSVRGRTYLDPSRTSVTLADWYDDWKQAQRGEATTQQRDSTSWRVHVEPAFGGWKLIDISNMAVDTWVSKLTRSTGVYATIKAFQVLDRLMAAALRDRRIPHNPCDGVKLPKPPAKHPDDLKPPTYDQLDLIRVCLPRHYHPLLVVAEETGLRWGELVNLRLQHVDFAAGTIAVREVIVELDGGKMVRKAQPKSSAGFRTVPLTARAAAAMQEQMRVRRPAVTKSAPSDGMKEEELIFRGPLGGVLSRNNFGRLWREAIKTAGIARIVPNANTGRKEWWPHFHSIRHAFASRLIAAGLPEPTVQQILGHERGGRVTWLYTHAPQKAVEDVRQVLDPGRRLRVVGSN